MFDDPSQMGTAAGFQQSAGNVGYAFAPVVKTKASGWLWAWAWGMPKTSKKADSAAKFILWASGKDYEKLVGQKPFVPLRIYVSDGTVHEIRNRELIWVGTGMAVLAPLISADPSNSLWQRDMASFDGRLGALMRLQKHPDEALKFYRSGQEIIERLSATDPDNLLLQRELWELRGSMGELLFEMGSAAPRHPFAGRRDGFPPGPAAGRYGSPEITNEG